MHTPCVLSTQHQESTSHTFREFFNVSIFYFLLYFRFEQPCEPFMIYHPYCNYVCIPLDQYWQKEQLRQPKRHTISTPSNPNWTYLTSIVDNTFYTNDCTSPVWPVSAFKVLNNLLARVCIFRYVQYEQLLQLPLLGEKLIFMKNNDCSPP